MNSLKTTVSPLFVGTVNFAKKMPAMQAEMMTPRMLWSAIAMMARLHWPVVARPPYLIKLKL